MLIKAQFGPDRGSLGDTGAASASRLRRRRSGLRQLTGPGRPLDDGFVTLGSASGARLVPSIPGYLLGIAPDHGVVPMPEMGFTMSTETIRGSLFAQLARQVKWCVSFMLE